MRKATLLAYKPPIGSEKVPGSDPQKMQLQYNPTQLSLVKETQWVRHPTRLARHTSVPEFLGSRPQTLTMTLVFDEAPKDPQAKDPQASVTERIKTLRTWCEPDQATIHANESSPPWIKLLWGEVPTFEWMILKRLAVQITRFSDQGKPLRAVCELTLEEVGA